MKLLITVINIWVIRGSPPSWPYRFSPSYPEAVLYLGRHLLAKHDELDQNFLLYLLKNGSSYSNITSKSIEWLISLLQHENIFELKIEQSWQKTCSERSTHEFELRARPAPLPGKERLSNKPTSQWEFTSIEHLWGLKKRVTRLTRVPRLTPVSPTCAAGV